MTIMDYLSKFTKLYCFIPEFVALKQMKMRRFEESLAFYIRHQEVGQPLHTYQDLYEWAAKVEQIKVELRALNPNPNNQKRK